MQTFPRPASTLSMFMDKLRLHLGSLRLLVIGRLVNVEAVLQRHLLDKSSYKANNPFKDTAMSEPDFLKNAYHELEQICIVYQQMEHDLQDQEDTCSTDAPQVHLEEVDTVAYSNIPGSDTWHVVQDALGRDGLGPGSPLDE